MPPRAIGGIGINECGSCNGIWAPADRFDQLINRAIEARKKGEQLHHTPRVKGANPAAQRVAYRKCPECEAFMQRRNFRKSSGVIIDICRNHGTWLDADELEQITGFVATGGNPNAEKLLADADRDAAAAVKRMRMAEFETGGLSRPIHSRSGGDFLGRTIVSVLKGILG
jgi:Zn-finger nucleic acid-binding protein